MPLGCYAAVPVQLCRRGDKAGRASWRIRDTRSRTGPTDIGASAASVAVNRALAIAPLGHQTLESPSFLRGEFPLGADLGELRK